VNSDFLDENRINDGIQRMKMSPGGEAGRGEREAKNERARSVMDSDTSGINTEVTVIPVP
jgi:hypothetical protein